MPTSIENRLTVTTNIPDALCGHKEFVDEHVRITATAAANQAIQAGWWDFSIRLMSTPDSSTVTAIVERAGDSFGERSEG